MGVLVVVLAAVVVVVVGVVVVVVVVEVVDVVVDAVVVISDKVLASSFVIPSCGDVLTHSPVTKKTNIKPNLHYFGIKSH